MKTASPIRCTILFKHWIFASLALWALACSPTEPGVSTPADAASDATAEQDAGGDAAAAEAACLAQNSPCVSAYWSNVGTCVVSYNVTAPCGEKGPCAGMCSADGFCTGPGAKVSCDSLGTVCGRLWCDGKGGCLDVKDPVGKPCTVKTAKGLVSGNCASVSTCDVSAPAVPLGAACTLTSKPICRSINGFTDEEGECIGEPTPGAYCDFGKQYGFCDASGTCVPTPFSGGKYCAPSGPCTIGGVTSPGSETCAQYPVPQGTGCPAANECSIGSCDGMGKCVQKLRTGECFSNNKGPCTPAYCSAEGKCVPKPLDGTPCEIAGGTACSPGICKQGSCVQEKLAEGAACGTPSGCHVPRCNAAGACIRVVTPGAACTVINDCLQGTCDASGACKASPKPAGSTCVDEVFGYYPDCQSAQCDGAGACKVLPKAEGGPCATNCKIGQCSSGKCLLKTPTSLQANGAICSQPSGGWCMKLVGTCYGGYCSFAVDVGGKCQVSNGMCSQGLCNAKGDCVNEWKGTPCTSTYSGYQCMATACGQEGGCGATTGLPTAAAMLSCSSSSADAACYPTVCNDLPGSVWAASPDCFKVALPDGATCTASPANPCAIAACQGGKCLAKVKPAGSACVPASPAPCTQYACDAKGQCSVSVPPPSGATCIVADGDTDCLTKACDSQGNCQTVPIAAGIHCGAQPDDGCMTHLCDGKGLCRLQPKPGGQCNAWGCNSATAKLGSPCWPADCWQGSCAAKGVCVNPKPAAAGTACQVKYTNGECDGTGRCILPAASAAYLIDKPCEGSFPCVKGGATYWPDLMCHGVVVPGAVCGSVCAPGLCGADGSCSTTLAPSGTVCGPKGVCGTPTCNGAGACVGQSDKVGQECPGYDAGPCKHNVCSAEGKCLPAIHPGAACKAAQCGPGVCSAAGYCLQQVGAPCSLATSTPCTAGKCNEQWQCVLAPTTGDSCQHPDATACKSGVCNNGKCELQTKTGQSCGSPGSCKASTCTSAGVCETAITPGASCPPLGACYKATCNSDGSCSSTPLPAGTACPVGGAAACHEGQCDGAGQCKTVASADGVSCHIGCWPGKCSSAKCKPDWGLDHLTTLCGPPDVCLDRYCCSGTQQGQILQNCVGKATGSCANHPTEVNSCGPDPCFKSACTKEGYCTSLMSPLPGCGGGNKDTPPEKKTGPGTCGLWHVCMPFDGCKDCISGAGYWYGSESCPFYGEDPNFCGDGNPCSAESCKANVCTITPLADGVHCGPFSTCKAGDCLPSP